jgi:hypothetical protein
MIFSAENISFQDRYKLTELVNGVDAGDSVAMRQLTPLAQDIQATIASLATYVKTSDFGGIFNQLRGQANLQDLSQVEAAIAAALAGLPEPSTRLASVAVKTVHQGNMASLTPAVIAQFGLQASDSGDIDDVNVTAILLDSPVAGESGLYQLKLNGQMQSLNAALVAANVGYYSRFYVIDSSREFAIRSLDLGAGTLEVEEIPYVDEYTGLGPVVVSNLNKTINLNFSALDFVMGADGFALNPAIRSALDLIPGFQQAIDTVSDLLSDLNTTLSNQITQLSGQITQLSGQVTTQGNSLSALQTTVQMIADQLANAFASVQEILFLNGVPNVRSAQGWIAAPSSFVQELSGDLDKGLFRISHNRGTMTVPTYFEANQLGEVQRACFLFDITALSNNAIEMRVEKYKPVLVMLQAGLKAYAVG